MGENETQQKLPHLICIHFSASLGQSRGRVLTNVGHVHSSERASTIGAQMTASRRKHQKPHPEPSAAARKDHGVMERRLGLCEGREAIAEGQEEVRGPWAFHREVHVPNHCFFTSVAHGATVRMACPPT